ncbi:hypothetical protein CUMW_242120 [Citrus unshiu]|uniref:Uncharacterized protein n=1 Tax=Citrus unshiu TaxID=55188 RepID=A0A2H5QLR5_CITUN|nr:hypothetical protein CUMW_242120 [Citrus unshiu]
MERGRHTLLSRAGTILGKASLSANSKQAPNGSKEQTEAIKTGFDERIESSIQLRKEFELLQLK